MTIFSFGDSSAPDSHKLSGQTIDSGVSIKDPVYRLNNTWFKSIASGNVLKLPTGVYEGNNAVILDGLLLTSGLTPGKFYYWDDLNGGITTSVLKIKVGRAISLTQLLVDIDTVNPTLISGISGYVKLGNAVPITAVIDKISFSTEAVSSLVSISNNSGAAQSATFVSDIKGYISGGGSISSVIDKLLFSDDSTDSTGSQLSISVNNLTGFESELNGYSVGGVDAAPVPDNSTSNIDKLIFSSDTNTSIATNLTGVRAIFSSVSNNANAYTFGGSADVTNTTVNLNIVDKFIFSGETIAANSSSLLNAVRETAAFNSDTFGYILGGSPSAGVIISNINVLDFKNDFITTTFLNISVAKSTSAGFNSGTDGYIAGGFTTVRLSNIEKLNFISNNIGSILSTLSINSSDAAGFDN